ncbi:unnamed protein product [Menidia menidia]|uniref:(Atlantic silverside) hypothetical protein n=1 Tax=Menidia menidia TaxID=238744 RepID=A0A8S4BPF7_9TELE|nr:unnamed protein product [Menidia menidia]
MAGKNHLMCVSVIAILASLELCEGQAVEEEVDKGGRPVRGSHNLRRVVSGLKQEPEAQKRPGSLVFQNDPKGGLYSSNVSQDVLAAKLKQMDPSVQCSESLMTLTVKRIGAALFLVDSGEETLTPLSQMRSSCGYSVKRSRRDVQYAANYQGCHVNKQDGDYVLPLRLWGSPVAMSCPVMLPSPIIFCFPSKMVLKISGVSANELKVKMSGTWQPLSLACSSCGLNFNDFAGELTLSAPYNTGPCMQVKDEEYLLTLQWADFELEATCPSAPKTDPSKGTSTPPSDRDQVPQNPLYPYFPMFSQYLEPPPTRSPATVASLPQFSFVAGDATNKPFVASSAQHPSVPFMPQFPPFFLVPRSETPAIPSSNQGAAAPQAPFPLMPHQYPIPFFPQFHMVPGISQPTTPTPPHATQVSVSTPSSSTGKETLQAPGLVFSVSKYPFNSFPKHPSSPGVQTQAAKDPKPAIQQPKPQDLYHRKFPIPVLHPQLNYDSSRLNYQLQAPAPTPVSAPSTEKQAAEEQFYQPHPFMPLYMVPKRGPMPVYLDYPAVHPINVPPSDHHKLGTIYKLVNPLFPFPSDQRKKALEERR